MSSDSIKIICGCGKSFKHRSGVYKHRKKCDKLAPIPSNCPKRTCSEKNCNYQFRLVDDLRDHLASAHDFTIVSEVLTFKNHEEFCSWKDEYERKTFTSFTRNNKKQRKTGKKSTIEYYYCHRSGQYQSRSSGKRKLKAQGSLKINNLCTANLKVKILEDGTVSISICHTHYGHKIDICHAKISKRDRQLLATQLSEGISKEKILHSLSPSNALFLERKNFIQRKDLNNISKAFGVKDAVKQTNYRLKVDDYVEEQMSGGKGPILLYKRKTENHFVHPQDQNCLFQEDDFALAFMNEFQKEMLQTFGNGIVCIEEIGGCSEAINDNIEVERLIITCVTVLDDFGDALPAAWLISNTDDDIVYTFFLREVKRLVGVICPKAVMTDLTSAFYDCWVEVFGGDPLKYICSWHVHQAWKKKIAQLETSSSSSLVYNALCMLLEENDMASFMVLMQRCLKEMRNNNAMKEFVEYFTNEFVSIQEQWAMCFRSTMKVDTNAHVESFHTALYMKCLNEKFKKSPNKCLILVLNFANDLNIARHAKQNLVNNKLKEAHVNINIQQNLVNQVSPTTYYVSSDETTGYECVTYSIVYVVEEQQETCSRKCNIKCEYCSVCKHLFKCSCSETNHTTDLCEHIHLVAIQKSKPVSKPPQNVVYVVEDETHTLSKHTSDHTYFEPVQEKIEPLPTTCEKQVIVKSKTVPEKSEGLEPALVDIKENLLQSLNLVSERLKKCGNKNTILDIQSRINEINFLLDENQFSSQIGNVVLLL